MNTLYQNSVVSVDQQTLFETKVIPVLQSSAKYSHSNHDEFQTVIHLQSQEILINDQVADFKTEEERTIDKFDRKLSHDILKSPVSFNNSSNEPKNLSHSIEVDRNYEVAGFT
jgi:hypothetical protein